MMGLRPVAEFQFADYMHPAYDQIVNQAATIRWRSVGGFGVPAVFRAPFGGGVKGGVYHSQSMEAAYCHVPGLKVVVPATPADGKGLLKSAIRDDDPVVFFEPKRAYRLAPEPWWGRRPHADSASPASTALGDDAHRSSPMASALHVAREAAVDARRLTASRSRSSTSARWSRWTRRRSRRRSRRPAACSSSTRRTRRWASVPRSQRSPPRSCSTTSTRRSCGSPADDCHLPYNGAEEAAIIPDAVRRRHRRQRARWQAPDHAGLGRSALRNEHLVIGIAEPAL